MIRILSFQLVLIERHVLTMNLPNLTAMDIAGASIAIECFVATACFSVY